MKIVRSVKLHYCKWITDKKRNAIMTFLSEYSSVVNYFIATYEEQVGELTRLQCQNSVLVSKCSDDTGTWLSANMIKSAFAEGYSMVHSAKSRVSSSNPYRSPNHKGRTATLQRCNEQVNPTNISKFDFMVTLKGIGRRGSNIRLNIPLRKHAQFNKWDTLGRRSSVIRVSNSFIQFSFKIETGEKKPPSTNMLGVDTGITHLATLSDGTHIGSDLRTLIDQLTRKQFKSKAYYRKKTQIKQYINEQLKLIPFDQSSLIVVEKLKNLKKNMKVKRRLTKTIRRVVANWRYAHILSRIQALCEENRVVFRSVDPRNTSRTCNSCGHTSKKNRLSQSIFHCQSCGHSGNADINASRNILERFILGQYGAEYQPFYSGTVN